MINDNEPPRALGPITVAFGKYSPPHIGHHAAAAFGAQYAKENNMEFRVYTSKRYMKKLKNPRPYEETPLSPEEKAIHLPRVLGVPQVHFEESPYSTIDNLLSKGHSQVHIILGSDRVQDTGPGLKEKYGDKVKIVSFGKERKKGAKGLAGASSTKMRQFAASNNFTSFKNMLPPHVEEQHALELFHAVRQGQQLAKVPVLEEVSAQTRLKLARVAKRTARRRAMLRKARQRRRRNLTQLKKRAKQNVKGQLRHRLYGKGSWSKLPYSTRAKIDQNVNKRKKIADSMIRRILPNVIKGESQRLQRLTRENVEHATEMLLEAIKGSRKPRSNKVGANSAKERAGARSRKQKQRQKEDIETKEGMVTGKYAVVRGRSGKFKGKIMVVDKQTYNPATHEVITKPEDFDLGDGQKILDDKGFINTRSSIELYGKVSGEKTAPLPKVKQSSKGNKTAKNSPPKEELFKKAKKEKEEPLPLPSMKVDPKWSMPTKAKDRGFKAADMEMSVATYLEMMVNQTKPENLLKEGRIDPEQYDLLLNNNNLQQAALRIINKTKLNQLEPNRYKFFSTGRMNQQISEGFASIGATDTTLKADVVLFDTQKPKNSRMISVKYGASQLGSPKEKEATAVLRSAYEKSKSNMSKQCRSSSDSFISNTLKEMSEGIKITGTVNALKRDTGGYASSNPKLKKITNDARERNRKIQDGFNKLIDNCPELRKEIVKELMRGDEKFAGTYNEAIYKMTGQKINAGVANELLAISEDGTSASLNVIDDAMVEDVAKEVKFYFAMKTTECGDRNTLKVYDKQFKPALLSAASSGSVKDFKKAVSFAQEQFKSQGVTPPKFSDKEIDTLMRSTAENGSVPDVLKFKTHCSKSAFRVGLKGQKEEVEENVVTKFIKTYILENTKTESSVIETQYGQIDDDDIEPLENPDQEDMDSDSWLNYSKQTIGDDIFKFLQFMGLEISGINTNEVDFSEMLNDKFATKTNVVYINGIAKSIPVMNSDNMNESMLIEKRNYRKEYDNYHSKPEQRKNRSKRVLARRLMAKLGKVKKGDGKDVDHKDGNPQNNGRSNLRVRDKSANRADN